MRRFVASERTLADQVLDYMQRLPAGPPGSVRRVDAVELHKEEASDPHTTLLQYEVALTELQRSGRIFEVG